MKTSKIKKSESMVALQALFQSVVEDIGEKRFLEIQEKYFDNKININRAKDLNRFIFIAMNYSE